MRKSPVQKWKLGEEVRLLAHQLDRPVCSADLRQHFRQNPERYPLYLQRLGQVLIKIARAYSERAVWPLGRMGFYAYYAPDPSPVWQTKLKRHELVLALEQRLYDDYPSFVGRLLEGPHDALARNAFAGFVAEWEPVIQNPLVQDWEHLLVFKQMLSFARSNAIRSFAATEPEDIILRPMAVKILRKENKRRVDASARVSIHRHLVRLVWPQSRLFPSRDKSHFCKSQLLAYIANRWPNDVDEAETAAGLVLALRYGVPPQQTGNSRQTYLGT